MFERPAFRRLRHMWLAFPDTKETCSWGHPNFRAGKRIFCAFEIFDGRPSVAFRLNAAEAKRLARRSNFFLTPYGRGVWVSRWVDVSVDWRLAAKLIERSYRSVASTRTLRRLESK